MNPDRCTDRVFTITNDVKETGKPIIVVSVVLVGS